MNGNTFKAAMLTIGLLTASFLSSIAIAINNDNSDYQNQAYDNQAGCMSCHQADISQPEQPAQKKSHKQTSAKVKTTE
jgi:cytochrome c551/c552